MSTMSPEQILRFRILGAVVTISEGSTTDSVDPIAIAHHIDAVSPMTRSELHDHVALLEGQGWVKGVNTLGGLAGVFLTPRGKDTSAQFERQQRDLVARLRQLQDEYLRWVYVETEIEDRHPTPKQFLALAPSYLGLAYTEREVEKAGARLKAAGHIYGPQVDQYDAPIYPEVTEKGRWVVENHKSVHDATATAAVHNYTTHVAGDANLAMGSTNVAQTIDARSGWGDAATTVLDVISEALVALPATVLDRVACELQEARSSVAADEPSRAKRSLTALAGFLGDTASGALGGLLAAQLLPVIALLG